MFITPDEVLRRAEWAQLQAISQRPAKGAKVVSLRVDRAGEGFVIAVRADYDGVEYHYAESVDAKGRVICAGFAPAPEREETNEERGLVYGGPSSDTRWQEAAAEVMYECNVCGEADPTLCECGDPDDPRR